METTGQLNFTLSDKRVVSWVLLIPAILMTAFYHWPEYSHVPKMGRNLVIIRANKEFKKYMKTAPVPDKILFTQSGPLVMEGVKMLYFKQKKRVIAESASFIESVSKLEAAISRCDLVVAQDIGTSGGKKDLPIALISNQVIPLLSKNSNFHLAKTIPVEVGQNIYLFERYK